MSHRLAREFRHYAEMHRVSERADKKVAAEIIQGLAAVKNSIDLATRLNAYVSEIRDVQKQGELMRIIGQLNLELANAQIELSKLRTESFLQNQRIEELEQENEALKTGNAEVMKGDDGLHYLSGTDEPICIGCYDAQGKTIRLSMIDAPGRRYYRCSACKTVVIPSRT